MKRPNVLEGGSRARALTLVFFSIVACHPTPWMDALEDGLPAGVGERLPVPPAEFRVDQPSLRLLGAEHGILLAGYDVEWWREIDEPLVGRFLERMATIHRELGIPATLFPVALLLDLAPEPFRPLVGDPLFEIGQHTLMHSRLKPLVQVNHQGTTFLPGDSLDEIERSLVWANEIVRTRLGVTPVGLTAPYGCYRGLADRPDILAILARAGIRYVRSWARNADDWQPVPLDAQPFWYAPQGFPDLLEIPIQGWQDSLWRETHGWEDKAGWLAVVRASIDEAASRNLVLGYDQHDWSSLRDDPDMETTRAILAHAKERGMIFATHTTFRQAAAEARGRR